MIIEEGLVIIILSMIVIDNYDCDMIFGHNTNCHFLERSFHWRFYCELTSSFSLSPNRFILGTLIEWFKGAPINTIIVY